jgi:hypothetical protein
MDEEEPAWRAVLREALDERFPYVRNTVTRDAIREFVTEQIEAAKQRGRREALTEAVTLLRGTSRDSRDYPAALTGARIIEAVFIDPAKAESP